MYPSNKAMTDYVDNSNINKEEIPSRITEMLKIVGLENEKSRIKGFSRGMKQRLGIAQALLHNPKLLILDEPFSGLDPQGVVEMRKFLKNLAQKYKIAIMVSSHMLAEMEQLCDTLAVINGGQLIEMKSIHQLKESIVGIVCGFTLSVCNFFKLIIFDGTTKRVALVVCLSLFLTVLLAKIIGALLPILADKIHLDPAVMASPLITTIVDAGSLMIYFKIACMMLNI